MPLGELLYPALVSPTTCSMLKGACDKRQQLAFLGEKYSQSEHTQFTQRWC